MYTTAVIGLLYKLLAKGGLESEDVWTNYRLFDAVNFLGGTIGIITVTRFTLGLQKPASINDKC